MHRSCVVLAPSDDTEDLLIRIEDGANVLDHSVLLGGTVVEKRAVTGTCTLGPKLCGNQIYGAFVLNRRVDLHAIDATPAR